ESRDQTQQRRLAGAILAEQRVQLAFLKVERDVAQRGEAAERFGHVLERDGGCRHAERHCTGAARLVRYIEFGADDAWPGWPCLGAYFEAHLACNCFAWKTPSRPSVPSASA